MAYNWKETRFVAYGNSYSGTHMRKILQDIMNNLYHSVLDATLQWIKKYVPKRTHQLQRSLLNSVNRTWYLGTENCGGEVSTYIDYATKIEGDPQHDNTWFEHSGAPATAYYGGHSGKVFLNDPEAIKEWFLEIEPFIQDKIKEYNIMYSRALLNG